MKADLHIHSTLSDGSNSCDAILKAAKAAGLTYLALTEHDTMMGFELWKPKAEAMGLCLIPGVEFSAYDFTDDIRAHILGYGMRDPGPIEALGAPLLRRRHENSLRQIAVLQSLGYAITEDEVAHLSEGGIIYKQHIMHVMVMKGYAHDIGGDTYRKLFKNGGPCHFDIAYIDATDAIRAIAEAGGIPVLAHPGQQMNLPILPRLVEAGLGGLELNHHANAPDYRPEIERVAGEYNLLLTGGSDHHGLYEAGSPEVGDYLCPKDTLPQLLARVLP